MEKKKDIFKNESPIFTPGDIDEVIEKYLRYCPFICKGRKQDVTFFLEASCSFDIETTSTLLGDDEIAYMYSWQLGLNGAVIIGRTWEEFLDTMHTLKDRLGLDVSHQMIIYVHNLGYEFQFIRKYFKWESVFAVDSRRPVKATTADGFTFKCSYLLTGKGLEEVGKNCLAYPMLKMSGDLDYSLIRHSDTPLTDKELKYCENDVRVIMSYIREQMEKETSITQIPLTKTGYVRKYIKEHTVYDNTEAPAYKAIMKTLTLTVKEFKQSLVTYTGGFTHANYRIVDKEFSGIDNPDEIVHSIDFTSSYPTVMIAENGYPMGKGRLIQAMDSDTWKRTIKKKACIAKMAVRGLRSMPDAPDHIISVSKCMAIKTLEDGTQIKERLDKKEYKDKITQDNGRLVDVLDPDLLIVLHITNIDYENFIKFYTWDEEQFRDVYVYKRGYLPKAFRQCILDFYKFKTQYKGVIGKEVEYAYYKELLNSSYGCCVYNFSKDTITYGHITPDEEEWLTPEKTDIYKAIEDYNKDPGRFLSYLWGIFVTSYSRRNLFYGLIAVGPEDYLYSDTDSIKMLHIEDHLDFINKYNDWITARLEASIKEMGGDPADASPADINGERHPLGVWDWETKKAPYLKFKTLGAKRYLVLQEMSEKELKNYSKVHKCEPKEGKDFITVDYQGKKIKAAYKMTVAGLPKHAITSLVEKYGIQTLHTFDTGLEFTEDDSEKKLLKYHDHECSGMITDYLGNPGSFEAKSYIYMTGNGFNFDRSLEYRNFLLGVRREKKF